MPFVAAERGKMQMISGGNSGLEGGVNNWIGLLETVSREKRWLREG
jgi:hypothetical protein